MVNYLQSLNMSFPLPAGMNPASWMLDVLGGNDSSGGVSMKEGAPRHNNSVKRNSSMRRSGSGITLDGLVLDQKFAASAQGQEAMGWSIP